MDFHHIGIACNDIQTTKEALGNLFPLRQEGEVIYDPEENVEVCMVELANHLKLELIQGSLVNTLINRGMTYYHLCFCVDDLDMSIRYLTERGSLVAKAPRSATLFRGKRVAFLYTPIGLVELLEEGCEDSPAE
jgi:methylmalonyl-CoA/ethylmalonyl-CoA epimerase